ncbi:MAG: cysteine desulfurase [Deltaproteobacteria bacterium]|nr:cysteine desulfurase [Deltaproteobacteria bacterium]
MTRLAPSDVMQLRKDFPILDQEVNGHPLVYLDNAATSQKPRAVIDAITHHYERDNANIHRGVHTLAQRSTQGYEGARTKLARFLGATDSREIVFTRGTTEAINLVASAFGPTVLGAGDEILVSEMEHHSNIVPWQLLCERTGAKLVMAPMDDRGQIDMAAFRERLSARTKIVALVHVSNALGTINPIEELVELAHTAGAHTVIDGAQAAAHLAIDVAALGCDFYATSGHKMFGPTGIGALWARAELLEAMPPWQGGGEMILTVTFEGSEYNEIPHKFEAGTPNVAGAVGLGATVDYLETIGMERIAAWEHELLEHGTEVLSTIPEIRLIGTAEKKAGVLSFLVEGVHAHDVGTILDLEGIAVRTGHHCAQPVMDHFGVAATTRASLAFYNTKEELDALGAGLRKVLEVFA